MRNSTVKSRRRKASDRPKKPYPTFPLTPHASGKWMKKIRGTIHYFGKWARRENGKLVRVEGDGWEEALKLYKADADDLHAGRTPRVPANELTVLDLCNRFLTTKHRQYEAGEISARMYCPGPTPPDTATGEYKTTTDRLVSAFGKSRRVDDLAADDFESLRSSLADQYGPVRLGNEIQKVRTVFKYGLEAGLIERPVRFGPTFKKPTAATMRKHRAQNGERMLEREQVLKLIRKADTQAKAMILLGVNAGFGNHDVASLPLKALDLDSGWVNFPRPKTGIARRCPLWPETVAALKKVIAERSEPKTEDAAELVFLTARGRPWLVRGIANPVSVAARCLMKSADIHQRGIGFYTLRHVFRTISDAARDPVAIDLIMGHTDPSMGGRYRERVEDSRLQVVAEHVRAWLFGKKPEKRLEPEHATSAKPVAQAPADKDGERPRLRLFAG